jgi:hypothetical protein
MFVCWFSSPPSAFEEQRKKIISESLPDKQDLEQGSIAELLARLLFYSRVCGLNF